MDGLRERVRQEQRGQEGWWGKMGEESAGRDIWNLGYLGRDVET